MRTNSRVTARTALVWIALLAAGPVLAQADPLPSWNDGAAKQAILKFVAATTTPGSADFVPLAERIATFDNDGTLWAEQPIYFQFAFGLDRAKAMAPQHPEWKTKEPFKSLLAGDLKAVLAQGDHAILEIMMASHAGMTTEEFNKIVADWLATAKHPRFQRPYTDLVYQPMLELLADMRANGFKTFIVSGGGVEFMRSLPTGSTASRPSRSSAARWIKAGSVSNDIFSGLDWFPTLLAAAGDTTIKDRLLQGASIGGKTFKVHLDGYNQLDYLTGKPPGARATTSLTSTTTACSWRIGMRTGRPCSASRRTREGSRSGTSPSTACASRSSSTSVWIPTSAPTSSPTSTTTGGSRTPT
jgi:hypothetical protein